MFCLGLACASGALMAEEVIYRWVDENGTVHFGATPPQEFDASLVNIDAPPEAPAEPNPYAPMPQAEAQQSTADQKREERKERRVEAAREKELMDARCEAMRAQKEMMEPNRGIVVQDTFGNTRRLNNAERMEYLNEADRFLQKNCN
jgi:hypothetical protein